MGRAARNVSRNSAPRAPGWCKGRRPRRGDEAGPTHVAAWRTATGAASRSTPEMSASRAPLPRCCAAATPIRRRALARRAQGKARRHSEDVGAHEPGGGSSSRALPRTQAGVRSRTKSHAGEDARPAPSPVAVRMREARVATTSLQVEAYKREGDRAAKRARSLRALEADDPSDNTRARASSRE